MKKQIKSQVKNIIIKTGKYTLSILLPVLIVSGIAYAASNLTPVGTPSTANFFTLSDIYTKLTTNATTTAGNHSVSTTTSPAGTFRTLTEIYNAIPLIDATKVATGTSYLGVRGTASAYSASPLKTGQAHCNAFDTDYNNASQIPCSGTYQDGDTMNGQKGIATSTIDNGNGTISDNATGLMWQKCADGEATTTCVGTPNNFLFDDGNGNLGIAHQPALNYCKNLNLGGYSVGSWRLPNVRELLTLVDYGKVNPSIDTVKFPNTQSDVYWSSTASEYNPNGAWIVDFYRGGTNGDNMDNSVFVRCVQEI